MISEILGQRTRWHVAQIFFSSFFFPFPNPRHPPRASHCPLLQYVTCRLAQLTHIPPGALTSFDVCMMLVMVTVLCKSTIYYMMTMTKLYFTERQGTIQMCTPTHKGSCGEVSLYVSFFNFISFFSSLENRVSDLWHFAKVWILCVEVLRLFSTALHTYVYSFRDCRSP